MKRLIVILLFLFIIPLCSSVLSKEKAVSIRMEIDKSRDIKKIPIKIVIKNRGKTVINTGKFEIASFSFSCKKNRISFGSYMQATLTEKSRRIKPNETFVTTIEWGGFVYSTIKRNNPKTWKSIFSKGNKCKIVINMEYIITMYENFTSVLNFNFDKAK